MEIPKYKAYIFDLDNTLYPEKDYLYQIYYLIGHYLHKQEKLDAKEVTEYLVTLFENVGRQSLFDKLIARYELKSAYMDEFLQLMRSAKLPVKLFLYRKMFDLITELEEDNVMLFILTNGNVQQQINKIKHIAWNGTEEKLKIYFADEFSRKPAPDGVLHILSEYGIEKSDALLIGDSKEDEYCAKAAGIDFMNVSEILLT